MRRGAALRTTLVWCPVFVLAGPRLEAQAAGVRPTYTAAKLQCARFAETSRSEIETQTGGGSIKATAERNGTWSFRARDSSGAVALEGWYDSLSLRRRTAEHEVSADTDGLIGGRYRGLLQPAGAYVELARPFVPDEVAELADLSGAARDLFPPLPPRPLKRGESYEDAGLELSRLPDTTVAGRTLLHFRLEQRQESGEAMPRGDTVPIPVRQTTVEQGDVYWSATSGLIRRTRDIVIEATVPAGGRVRQAARSRVVQRVELTRLPSPPSCD